MNPRLRYFFMVIFLIILGILSRKIAIIPLCIGDFLYAMMLYFSIRMLFSNLSKSKSSVLSLLICYVIEFSQLYQENWLNEIRNTVLGQYILGQGFLYSDLVAYAFGIVAAYLFDKIVKIIPPE